MLATSNFIMLNVASKDAEYVDIICSSGEEYMLDQYTVAIGEDEECIVKTKKEIGKMTATKVTVLSMYSDGKNQRFYSEETDVWADDSGKIWIEEERFDDVFC